MTTNSTIRVFIAAMLPQRVRDALVEMGREFAADLGSVERALRWARPEGLHLTFYFEGGLHTRLVPDVGRAMGRAAAEHEPFILRLGGIGAFPNERRARVIWAGVEGDLDRLGELAKAIEREMRVIGLRPDKPFKPHLTLARVRDGVSDVELAAIADTLRKWSGRKPSDSEFSVDEVTLVRSQLDSGGSIYTSLGTARLRGVE